MEEDKQVQENPADEIIDFSIPVYGGIVRLPAWMIGLIWRKDTFEYHVETEWEDIADPTLCGKSSIVSWSESFHSWEVEGSYNICKICREKARELWLVDKMESKLRC